MKGLSDNPPCEKLSTLTNVLSCLSWMLMKGDKSFGSHLCRSAVADTSPVTITTLMLKQRTLVQL